MSEKHNAVAVRSEPTLRDLSMVFDVPLHIAIEVGRLRLRVRDLVKLTPGAVLELRKPAGEPFDICINGVLVARGEVINVEQSSGVRVIELQKPAGT